MVNKPDYIQFIEVQDGVFSVMKFHKFGQEIIKYLDDKNFTRVYEVSIVSKVGKAKWSEVIFKTKQDFYLHLVNDTDDEEYSLNIYYKADKRNELLFLTSQILKPFKDGIINNTGTQEEN